MSVGLNDRLRRLRTQMQIVCFLRTANMGDVSVAVKKFVFENGVN